jgi:hypothetical protein
MLNVHVRIGQQGQDQVARETCYGVSAVAGAAGYVLLPLMLFMLQPLACCWTAASEAACARERTELNLGHPVPLHPCCSPAVVTEGGIQGLKHAKWRLETT